METLLYASFDSIIAAIKEVVRDDYPDADSGA
jgi:hypothetical protein